MFMMCRAENTQILFKMKQRRPQAKNIGSLLERKQKEQPNNGNFELSYHNFSLQLLLSYLPMTIVAVLVVLLSYFLWKVVLVFFPQQKPTRVQLKVIEGHENYANCAGIYVASHQSLNGLSVYICKKNDRFIGWNGDCWVCTSLQYLHNVLKDQERGFGGFRASTNNEQNIFSSEWDDYKVERL